MIPHEHETAALEPSGAEGLADAMTRLHLEDVRREIQRVLEPPRT